MMFTDDDLYLRCQDCGWAFPAEHTAVIYEGPNGFEVGEKCSECDGHLDAVHDSGECPRCGQTGGETVCPGCRKIEREPQGEAMRLFAPAPTRITGQMHL